MLSVTFRSVYISRFFFVTYFVERIRYVIKVCYRYSVDNAEFLQAVKFSFSGER